MSLWLLLCTKGRTVADTWWVCGPLCASESPSDPLDSLMSTDPILRPIYFGSFPIAVLHPVKYLGSWPSYKSFFIWVTTLLPGFLGAVLATLGCYNNNTIEGMAYTEFTSRSPRGCESKTKAPANLVSSESPLPGGRRQASCCVLTWQRAGESCLRSYSWELHPHDLTNSPRSHLLILSTWS